MTAAFDNAPKAVCFITDTGGMGGTEVHTLHLIKALVGRGYLIELIANCHHAYDQPIASSGFHDKVRIIHTELGGIRRNDRAAFRDWTQLFGTLRSKILIFPKGHHTFGRLGFLRACRNTFDKIFAIEHLEPEPLRIWRYNHFVVKQASCEYIDQFLAVSSKVKERLAGEWCVPSHKVAVVRNGVPWREFTRDEERGMEFRGQYGIPPDAFVFGMLTRLSEEKGVDIALKAMQLLRRKHLSRPVRLVVAGTGRDSDKLTRLIKQLQLQTHVKLIGFVQTSRDILSSFDAILFPSRAEGLPLGLLEGMAAGCIPIVTRVGGMPEALASPDVGWVVRPEAPEELCGAMYAVAVADRQVIAKMRQNGLRRVQEQFDLAECHRKIFEVCSL